MWFVCGFHVIKMPLESGSLTLDPCYIHVEITVANITVKSTVSVIILSGIFMQQKQDHHLNVWSQLFCGSIIINFIAIAIPPLWQNPGNNTNNYWILLPFEFFKQSCPKVVMGLVEIPVCEKKCGGDKIWSHLDYFVRKICVICSWMTDYK